MFNCNVFSVLRHNLIRILPDMPQHIEILAADDGHIYRHDCAVFEHDCSVELQTQSSWASSAFFAASWRACSLSNFMRIPTFVIPASFRCSCVR